ncbi:MAG: hypothetical protein HFG54_00690 [Lachnospiraceae bacterium]|jgi:hypothetical protein|nr:hypothetical protein [Lachnospiraceae bacterium]
MKLKSILLVTSCVFLLCGCTKSNIIRPNETMAPDFNLYMDIEIDVDQLHDNVDDIYLDPDDYPMASAIDFELHLDEAYINIDVVVKDGTSPEDTSWYADQAIKGINDQVAVQDFSYGESDEDTFGGLYQDNEIHLKVYDETSYKNGTPIFETTIPMDEYMTFEIGS